MIEHKAVKSILNKHKKRDSWFLDNYSLNPYEGCGFNCTYCYVHGSKYGENLEYEVMCESVHLLSWQSQQQLKRRADAICKEYKIKNSIR